jgi:phosphoserine phosphatase
MFIATLIAEGLTAGQISEASDRLAGMDCAPGAWHWLDEGRAADLHFMSHGSAARAALEGTIPFADVVVQPAEGREKRLLVADMDSTMITVECIDELADYAGIKARIAEVTERAMRGELDFAAALDARVALLARSIAAWPSGCGCRPAPRRW